MNWTERLDELMSRGGVFTFSGTPSVIEPWIEYVESRGWTVSEGTCLTDFAYYCYPPTAHQEPPEAHSTADGCRPSASS